jgi:hypothetical protein
MTQERRYVPEIGKRIKLATFSDYSSRELHVWSWMEVQAVSGDTVTAEILNGSEHTGQVVTVPLTSVDKPIGWAPRYTIHVQPDKVADVLAWLKRGIVVRQSQYIGDGSTAFQPMDNADQPHWKYGEITDAIPPAECDRVFRVVKLETVYDAGIPSPCQYCNGTGIHTSNPSLTDQTESTDRCETCGVHLHFSFDEPWHRKPNPSHLDKPDSYCSYVKPAGHCWCCNGTGRGIAHLSGMDPKQRKQAIKTLESEGWKVWYQKRGSMWLMERETVVKDWAEQ